MVMWAIKVLNMRSTSTNACFKTKLINFNIFGSQNKINSVDLY